MRLRARALTAATTAATLAMAVVAFAPAAHAMETSQFGIEPGPAARRLPGTERLLVDAPRGGTAHTEVRVWNRLDRPLRLRLETVPATLDAGGTGHLGGDDTGAQWTSVDQAVVDLPAHGEATVPVTVRAPRRASGERRIAAVLAQPDTTGSTPAVLERLAVVVAVDPVAAGNAFATWATAAAVLALAALAGSAAVVKRRRKVTGDEAPPSPAATAVA